MLQSITLNVQCIECSAQFSSLLPRFSLKCWSNSHLWPATLLQCQDWPSRTHCWLLGVFDYLNQFVKTQSNFETIFLKCVFVYFLRSKRVGCGHLEVGCGFTSPAPPPPPSPPPSPPPPPPPPHRHPPLELPGRLHFSASGALASTQTDACLSVISVFKIQKQKIQIHHG